MSDLGLYKVVRSELNDLDQDERLELMEFLCNEVEDYLSDEDLLKMTKKIYYRNHGGHFNEFFAREKVEDIGEHWSSGEASDAYRQVRSKIPEEYNEWDWYVLINMIFSDWAVFVQDELGINDVEGTIIKMSINWLNDLDNPYGNEKVWGYLMGGR